MQTNCKYTYKIQIKCNKKLYSVKSNSKFLYCGFKFKVNTACLINIRSSKNRKFHHFRGHFELTLKFRQKEKFSYDSKRRLQELGNFFSSKSRLKSGSEHMIVLLHGHFPT